MPSTQELTLTIAQVDLGSHWIKEILDLHRAEKRYLGFLPDAGFDDRAAAGTLLAAIRDDHLLGYVLYDLPGDRVKIVHLCVAPIARGEGVARLLIDEVSDRHRDRLGIQLSCRRSFPAANLWPRLEFRPIGNRPGRSLEGHLLTVWFRDHGHPDLFSAVEEERDLVAVDQMVFQDLVVDGDHAEESRRLFDDWVQELVELCVTDKVFLESNACEEDALREALLTEAREWRNLSRSSTVASGLVERVGELAPQAGEGDHQHVAAAIAGGATYFVTRDGLLLEGSEAIGAALGVNIIRPEQLIDRLDRARRVGLYEPIVLQGTQIIGSRLPAADQDEFTATLLNNGSGERAADLRQSLRPALADPSGHEVIALRDGSRLIGGFIRRRCDQRLHVEFLRVAGTDPLSRAVARQLVFAQRQTAASERLGEVVVEDSHPPSPIRDALRAEGFERYDANRWSCLIETGILAGSEFYEPPADRTSAAALERSHWPVKLTGKEIPTYMISIHPTWAEGLFDEGLAAQTLLSRELGLGLSREHVYYRSPLPGNFIDAPARILWYVKGGRVGHEEGHLRAVSHLAAVLRGRPESLHRRFSQLGAWTLAQVRNAADHSGQVMALRFLDTEVFDHPLSLDELRLLYSEAGTNFQAPQSPLQIDEQIFSRLYRQSSAYVDS
ncbi:MAG TPA: GNAT family N-acetyltransferase [Solirubrobacterales bacterium]|jgi:GNAT superfamily N-acetyltransferase/predicted nucleic acid-binding protein